MCVGSKAIAKAALPLALFAAQASEAESAPCANPDYAHAISYLLPLKYGPDYTHFDYTNPAAPKTGRMRLPVMGTFDNYNAILEKGRVAAGYDDAGGLVYDRLLEPSIDEPVSAYGRLADGIAKGPNLDWIAFRLRDDAYWHDGVPISMDDVLFTYEVLREHGSVSIRTALADIDHIFPFGEREVCFVRRQDRELNPILPFAIGNYNILPKHYWDEPEHDITKTTVDPPLASGPYRLKYAEVGRVIEYERVDDYWGRDIPVNKGRYNFDEITFDHFADEGRDAGGAQGARVRHPRGGRVEELGHAVQLSCSARGLVQARAASPRPGRGALVAHLLEHRAYPACRHPRARGAVAALRLRLDQPRALLWLLQDGTQLLPRTRPWRTRACRANANWPSWSRGATSCHPASSRRSSSSPTARDSAASATTSPRAIELFAEAGWEIRDGVMTNVETGEPFTLDFIGVSYYSIRQNLSLVDNLKRVGVQEQRPLAGSVAVALPQPHRPLRRQLGAVGARPHTGPATAQLGSAAPPPTRTTGRTGPRSAAPWWTA